MDVVQTTIMVDQQVQPSADHLNRRLRPASDAPRKMEPFEQKLTVLGPQLHAEPCPRGHSLVVLPVTNGDAIGARTKTGHQVFDCAQ